MKSKILFRERIAKCCGALETIFHSTKKTAWRTRKNFLLLQSNCTLDASVNSLFFCSSLSSDVRVFIARKSMSRFFFLLSCSAVKLASEKRFKVTWCEAVMGGRKSSSISVPLTMNSVHKFYMQNVLIVRRCNELWLMQSITRREKLFHPQSLHPIIPKESKNI